MRRIDQYTGGGNEPVGVEKRLRAGINALLGRAGQNVNIRVIEYIITNLPLGAKVVTFEVAIESPKGDYSDRQVRACGHLDFPLNTFGFLRDSDSQPEADEEWRKLFTMTVSSADGQESTEFSGALVERAGRDLLLRYFAEQQIKTIIA